VCLHRSLVEGVVIVIFFHFTRVAPGETLDLGIPGRTMVAQLASLSLMRALFLGAAVGRWFYEVCQELCVTLT
jgi:hypothetical protein